MAMAQAPVIRGDTIEAMLPSDLREIIAWLNDKLPDRHRPICPICHSRCKVLYAPGSVWWCCSRFEDGLLREADFSRLIAYAKRRLTHRPKDCFRRN